MRSARLLLQALTLSHLVAESQTQALNCSDLTLPRMPGFEVLSSQATEVRKYSQQASSGLSFCNLTVVLQHTDDIVYTWVYLPLSGWNGRLLVGFAASTSDAGLTLNNTIDASGGAWGIKGPGVLNTGLFENFAYRSIHDAANIGKAAVLAFYGERPRYSYYSGCSTGGRQGYLSAQRYPSDFDGIMANSPALFTPRVSPGDFWPSVVMGNIDTPPMCIFTAYQDAIVEACDALDGVTDGIISRTGKCKFDPSSLVGTAINCTDTGGLVTISTTYADVIAKILQGARRDNGDWMWYGVPPGAPFSGLAATITNGGKTKAVPFSAAEAWIRYFVFKDPNYPTSNMTFADFQQSYDFSVTEFSSYISTDNQSLTSFRKAGGKLLTWHGLADAYISHESSVRYRRTLEERNGGAEDTNTFHRLFLAPGAGHCSGGVGPVPIDPLGSLMSWVENGTTPDTLLASTSGDVRTVRNLCPYPYIQIYANGKNPNNTDAFYCA